MSSIVADSSNDRVLPGQSRGVNPVYVQRMLVASANANKILELQTVADGYSLVLAAPSEIQRAHGLAAPPVVEEDGASYRENALKKARAFAEWSGMPAIGDDSGLEISALGGRPGVFSARYAGEGASDKVRMAKVLAELAELELAAPGLDRRACFRCTLVLAYPNGAVLWAEGELKGTILYEPRGDKGFGYDPIVLIDELGQTLAEVDFSITCENGFRARAARELFGKLLALRAPCF